MARKLRGARRETVAARGLFLQLAAIANHWKPLVSKGRRISISRIGRKIGLCSNKSCADRGIRGFPRRISKYCRTTRIKPTGDKMAVQMTKSQLIEKISGETEVAKKDVKGVLETLATVG